MTTFNYVAQLSLTIYYRFSQQRIVVWGKETKFSECLFAVGIKLRNTIFHKTIETAGDSRDSFWSLFLNISMERLFHLNRSTSLQCSWQQKQTDENFCRWQITVRHFSYGKFLYLWLNVRINDSCQGLRKLINKLPWRSYSKTVGNLKIIIPSNVLGIISDLAQYNQYCMVC